jgi:hypothetical protein
MTVFKEPAGHTLEIVPSFERLHATDHGLHIDQGMIAVGTPLHGRGNLRVPRHGCRSHQVWSATLAGCGGILTHAGEESNHPAALPSRNLVHLAVALSLFRASRCPSEATPTTKLSPLATFMISCALEDARPPRLGSAGVKSAVAVHDDGDALDLVQSPEPSVAVQSRRSGAVPADVAGVHLLPWVGSLLLPLLSWACSS